MIQNGSRILLVTPGETAVSFVCRIAELEQKLGAARDCLGHLLVRAWLRVKPPEGEAEMGDNRTVDTVELLDPAMPEPVLSLVQAWLDHGWFL